MKQTTLIPVLVMSLSFGEALISDLNLVHAKSITPLVMPKIQVIPLTDTVTERRYELYVKLPEGYMDNPNKRYPVLYITDALWSFELLSGTAEYVLEDIILVGLSWQIGLDKNKPHVSRFRDYKPHIIDHEKGQARQYLRFVREQVFALIEKRFRTIPGQRAYFGYSLASMLGAYILLTQPETFKYYILGSPSLSASPDTLFLQPLATRPDLTPHVFISYGEQEKQLGQETEYFADVLKRVAKSRLQLSIHKEIIKGADHATAFPKTAVNSLYWLARELKKSSTAPEVKLPEQANSFRVTTYSIPDLPKAFVDTTPSKRSDGIKVGTFTVDNKLNTDVVKVAREMGEDLHGKHDSFLIARHDTLQLESYFRKGRINLPHGQASATKSYTSLAIGRAIQLGYLSMEDLHKPILSFLKDVDTTHLVEGVERITLAHTLSMRSGLRIDEDTMRAIESAPELFKGQKLAQAYFEKSAPVTEASQTFLYGNDPSLTILVLDAVVPGTVKEFIQKELLDKIGVKNYYWGVGDNGVARAGSGVSLTSRDMLKVGTLILHNGRWNGKQLVSKEYIEMATRSQAQPVEEEYAANTYGYYFWLVPMEVNGHTYMGKLAWGGGGQYIMVFNELDLVIVITGRERDDKAIELIKSRVLPAFTSLSQLNGQ